MDVDIIVKEMNNSSINIDIEFATEKLDEINQMIIKLEGLITRKLGIKKYIEREVKTKLNLVQFKNDTLVSKFNETNDDIYNEIIEYRKLCNKKKAIENILQNTIIEVSVDKKIYGSYYEKMDYCNKVNLVDIISGYITPIFTKNAKNMISLSKPSLNFLSIEIIKKITELSKSKTFENMCELQSFLNRFDDVLRYRDGKISYFVKGLTLYFNFKKIMPIDVVREFGELNKSKFPNKLVAVNDFIEIQRELLLTESLNSQNYDCFKVAWEKYKSKLVLTIELIKEENYDLFNFKRYDNKSKRDVFFLEILSERRQYEDKLIKLINELKMFDNIAEKYDLELIDILKGYKDLELLEQKKLKEYDEMSKDMK